MGKGIGPRRAERSTNGHAVDVSAPGRPWPRLERAQSSCGEVVMNPRFRRQDSVGLGRCGSGGGSVESRGVPARVRGTSLVAHLIRSSEGALPVIAVLRLVAFVNRHGSARPAQTGSRLSPPKRRPTLRDRAKTRSALQRAPREGDRTGRRAGEPSVRVLSRAPVAYEGRQDARTHALLMPNKRADCASVKRIQGISRNSSRIRRRRRSREAWSRRSPVMRSWPWDTSKADILDGSG